MSPRTPDYFPGRREEESILFLSGSDVKYIKLNGSERGLMREGRYEGN